MVKTILAKNVVRGSASYIA